MSDDVEFHFFTTDNGHALAVKMTGEGPDPLKADEALVEAARRGKSKFVESLLKVELLVESKEKQRPVNVNATNDRRQTAIHLAIEHRDAKYGSEQKYLKIIELLLRENANINAQDSDGQTPLHYAVKFHNSAARELLFQYELLDVGIRDVSGDCALQIAARRPDLLAVYQLIPVYISQRKYVQLAQVLLEGHQNEWLHIPSYQKSYKRFFRRTFISFLSETRSLAEKAGGLIPVCPFIETPDGYETSVEEDKEWLKWAIKAREVIDIMEERNKRIISTLRK